METASPQQVQQHRFRLVVPVMGSRDESRSRPMCLFAQEAIALPTRGFLDSRVRMNFLRCEGHTPYNDLKPDLFTEPDRCLRVSTGRLAQGMIDVNEHER